MKKSVLFLGSMAAAILLAGCVERRVVYVPQPAPPSSPPPAEPAPPSQPLVEPAPQAEVAPEAPPPGEVPPPPQTEVVTVAPGPDYVWLPGAWVWHGRWVWGGGRWAIGPHPHAVWYAGHWERHGRRSVYIRGYWR